MLSLKLQVSVLVLVLAAASGSSKNKCTFNNSVSHSSDAHDSDSAEDTNIGDRLQADYGPCNTKITTPKNMTTFKNMTGPGYIPVDCGQCRIYYDIKLKAWADHTDTRKQCYGLTPDLLSSSLDCAWKNNCNLRYSSPTIVWSTHDHVNCVGEDSVRIDMKYSCVNQDIVIHDVMKSFQTIEAVKGLVRSHNSKVKTHYLEKYTMDISPPEDFRTNLSCVNLQLTKNGAKGDSLLVQDKISREQCEMSSKNKHFVWCTSSIRLVFVVKTQGKSKEFKICFKWFDIAELEDQKTMKCFNNKEKDLPTFDLIRETESEMESGIIRSHSSFPWNYPHPKPNPSATIPVWTHYTHTLKKPKSRDLTVIKFHVKRMDLDKLDELLINCINKTVATHKNDLEGKEITCTSQNVPVALNFSVLHTRYNLSSGFLLCYKWLPSDKIMKEKPDLCDQFVHEIDLLCPTRGDESLNIVTPTTWKLSSECQTGSGPTGPSKATETIKKGGGGKSKKGKGKQEGQGSKGDKGDKEDKEIKGDNKNKGIKGNKQGKGHKGVKGNKGGRETKGTKEIKGTRDKRMIMETRGTRGIRETKGPKGDNFV